MIAYNQLVVFLHCCFLALISKVSSNLLCVVLPFLCFCASCKKFRKCSFCVDDAILDMLTQAFMTHFITCYPVKSRLYAPILFYVQ